MDWVFDNEEQAIILEDDCVPSVAFFEYCDFFLDKYKEDKSIGFISGANYLKIMFQRKKMTIYTVIYFVFMALLLGRIDGKLWILI